MFKSIIRALFYKLPKVGDIYIFDGDKNPFKKRIEVNVLEVKDGYVRYKYKNNMFSDNMSLEGSSFNYSYFKKNV
jgi:hypothetical protein